MKHLGYFVLAFALALLARGAFADEVSVGGAFGVNHSHGNNAISLAYLYRLPEEYNLKELFFVEGQATFFHCPETFIGGVGLGVEYNPIPEAYVRGLAGLAGLSRTTPALGGHFQFQLKAGAGVRFGDFRVGPVYTHYSSAGIYSKNSGEDFVGIEVGVSF